MRDKIMLIVNQICSTQSTGCRSLNKSDLARELVNLANIPGNAEIQEIPLDWDNMTEIMFLIPNDDNYYSLFAGIGCDGNFHFDLSIAGKLEGKYFNFFDHEKPLPIDYFFK